MINGTILDYSTLIFVFLKVLLSIIRADSTVSECLILPPALIISKSLQKSLSLNISKSQQIQLFLYIYSKNALSFKFYYQYLILTSNNHFIGPHEFQREISHVNTPKPQVCYSHNKSFLLLVTATIIFSFSCCYYYTGSTILFLSLFFFLFHNR
jgi:hypothetical protein